MEQRKFVVNSEERRLTAVKCGLWVLILAGMIFWLVKHGEEIWKREDGWIAFLLLAAIFAYTTVAAALKLWCTRAEFRLTRDSVSMRALGRRWTLYFGEPFFVVSMDLAFPLRTANMWALYLVLWTGKEPDLKAGNSVYWVLLRRQVVLLPDTPENRMAIETVIGAEIPVYPKAAEFRGRSNDTNT